MILGGTPLGSAPLSAGPLLLDLRPPAPETIEYSDALVAQGTSAITEIYQA